MPFAAFFDILGSTRIFTRLADEYSFDDQEWQDGLYARARAAFHQGLEAAVAIAPVGFRFKASFSDCAYLVYDDPAGVLTASSVAMTRFYRTLVPVRGGIGYGNFGLGQTVHHSDRRGSSTESSFYGSSLVHAHAAESSGLKGLRLFVHDSAASRLAALHGTDFVHREFDYGSFEEGDPRREALPATLITLSAERTSGVSHELCFIGEDSVADYLAALAMIKRAYPPDGDAEVHYQQSRDALTRFGELRE